MTTWLDGTTTERWVDTVADRQWDAFARVRRRLARRNAAAAAAAAADAEGMSAYGNSQTFSDGDAASAAAAGARQRAAAAAAAAVQQLDADALRTLYPATSGELAAAVAAAFRGGTGEYRMHVEDDLLAPADAAAAGGDDDGDDDASNNRALFPHGETLLRLGRELLLLVFGFMLSLNVFAVLIPGLNVPKRAQLLLAVGGVLNLVAAWHSIFSAEQDLVM
jgi:hypothetical protein